MHGRNGMTRAEKIAFNRAETRIDIAYRRHCTGMPIDVMDIGKVFKVGHAAIAAGADDGALARAIVEFVQTIVKKPAALR